MTDQKSNRVLIAVALLFFMLITAFHVISARAGYSHYRDQHVGTALLYAKSGIDLLRPIIVGFNATNTPTPQELPVWQALAALVFRHLGPWFGWANLLSLLLFAAGLWPLHALTKSYLGSRGAWWTLLFLMAQPIVIIRSGQASVESLCLALSFWFVYCAYQLLVTGHFRWLALATIFGALSAVTKLPLFMCGGLMSFLLLLQIAPRSRRHWLRLVATGLGSGIVFLLWTRYTDACLAAAEFPLVDLRVKYGNFMWFWYFGDWGFRLNPFNWAKAGWAALNALFGSFAFVGLAGWALLSSRNRIPRLWLLAALCTTLVFCHLVLVHRHYFMLYSAAVAMLCASTAIELEERIRSWTPWTRHIAFGGMLFIILLSAVQGLIGSEVTLEYDPYPRRIAAILRKYTAPEDKLLIQGGGWGGLLIISDRDGLIINDTGILEDEAKRQRLRELGFTKLVMISESPLLNALQQTNPGNLSRERISYRNFLTPIAAQFPTTMESPDVLIKELRN